MAADRYLLEDGASHILLEDAASFLLLEDLPPSRFVEDLGYTPVTWRRYYAQVDPVPNLFPLLSFPKIYPHDPPPIVPRRYLQVDPIPNLLNPPLLARQVRREPLILNAIRPRYSPQPDPVPNLLTSTLQPVAALPPGAQELGGIFMRSPQQADQPANLLTLAAVAPIPPGAAEQGQASKRAFVAPDAVQNLITTTLQIFPPVRREAIFANLLTARRDLPVADVPNLLASTLSAATPIPPGAMEFPEIFVRAAWTQETMAPNTTASIPPPPLPPPVDVTPAPTGGGGAGFVRGKKRGMGSYMRPGQVFGEAYPIADPLKTADRHAQAPESDDIERVLLALMRELL